MIIHFAYYMGVETFRADSDLSDVLKDSDFMKNFKNKTEMYNTAVKRLYNFSKGTQMEEKPITQKTFRVKLRG